VTKFPYVPQGEPTAGETWTVFITVGRKGAEERLSSALRGRGGRRVGHRGMTSGKAPRLDRAALPLAEPAPFTCDSNGPAGHPALRPAQRCT